jgi:hypothetical protein
MKTLSFFTVPICFALACLVGCATTPSPVAPTSTQQLVANAVEDAISIGLVPVFTKNPSYLAAANTVALGLGSFAGDTLTPADVAAFLAKTPLAEADQRIVAGVVTASWQIYVRRYSQQVSTATRPDVKLFLAAVSNGIKAAAAATPQ